MESVLTAKKTIARVVSGPEFRLAEAMLDAGGFKSLLNSPQPLTFFAPSDDAFNRLPAETFDMLFDPIDNELLVDLLKYNVVPGVFSMERLKELTKLHTLGGNTVHVTNKYRKILIDEGLIISGDIACSNGIIHIVNSVIFPK